MRVASIGREGNPTVPCLESTLDAGGLPIQEVEVFVEVFASRFLQHAIEHYHAKE